MSQVTGGVEFFRVCKDRIEHYRGGLLVTTRMQFESKENEDLARDLLASRNKKDALLNKGKDDDSIRIICNYILHEGYQL